MNCTPTPLNGLLLLTPAVFTDERGHFFESFNAKTFKQVAGIQPEFVQTNESLSKRGVLRGMHWQTAPKSLGKLVRVVHVLNIDWPLKRAGVARPILSEKDAEGMPFTELNKQ